MSIFNHFHHINLNTDQSGALRRLEAFLESNVCQVFILKGYAGSGKTTLLKGLVEYLHATDKSTMLMAPTGRAAKVIRERTGQEAFTIHKSIYSYDDIVEVEEDGTFYYYYTIRNNKDAVNKIYIVDEASMISDMMSQGEFFRFGTGHLLTDLFTYTRVNQPNINSKIIFVGDPCQLPPVTDSHSRAFDADYLMDKFNISIDGVEMKEVMRQKQESGLMHAASRLRKGITSGYFIDFDLRPNNHDLLGLTSENFLSTWQDTDGSKIIIASKNKTCSDLNRQIRELRYGIPDLPICKSDILIMGGNNYRKGVFNGEFALVNEVSDMPTSRTIAIRNQQPVTLYWRDIELVFPDSNEQSRIIKGKVLENFLHGDNTLRPEEIQALQIDFRMRHPQLRPKTPEFKDAIMQDEYVNCLLVKYGYAITGHKAQGGEWDAVFTVWDHDNTERFNCYADAQRKEGKTNANFYRWAYTTVTRASKKLFTLNPPFFNSYSSMSFLDTIVVDALRELTGDPGSTVELTIDDEILAQLTKFGLLDQPLPIQDHFLSIWSAVRKQYIDVTGWEKLGYEIRYHFKRENDTAVFRTYVNGRDEFRNPLIPMPNLSPNPAFNEVISSIIIHLPHLTIKRNTAETILEGIEFEADIEEKFPFTRSLFDDLTKLLGEIGIRIDRLTHLEYKERYTLTRKHEVAVIDFEYNIKGFFGRVVPVQNQTNSKALLADIKAALQTLKQEENAH